MIGALANHLWQSTAFALAVAMLAIAFRHNQACVRYGLWLCASVKFFIPFALLMSLGGRSELAPAAQQLSPPEVSAALVQMSEPFDLPAGDLLPASSPSPNRLGVVLIAIWGSGFFGIIWMRLHTWRRVRAAVRASTPVVMPFAGASDALEIRATPGVIEPGVVGLFRPTLLLPADLTDHLTPAQLEAVLAHELCHVRRRDNLTAALHMIVEAVFWFHPLVWWIGTRLVDERERACDEHVLRVVDEPRAYAEGILAVCKRYVEAPVTCMSGVGGADLRRRIEAIMFNRIGVQLTMARRAVLGLAAVAAFVAPFFVGMMSAPIRASAFARAAQEYEAATVRPCGDDTIPVAGGRGGATGGNMPAPNRVSIQCVSLERIIGQAYVTARDLSRDDPSATGVDHRIKGLPAWARSEQYTIEAKAAGLPERRVLMGAMLRTLLEDRFKLKVHREKQDAPLYALTIAKGGLNLKPNKDGDCIRYDPAAPPSNDSILRGARAGGIPHCGSLTTLGGAKRQVTYGGATMRQLAEALSRFTDRAVLDRTGLDGEFNFHLEFADETAAARLGTPVPDPGEPGGVSIFTAVEELGLKLEPIKGAREFIVIDHVERPGRQ